jgi:predicted dehydrogenase
MEYDIGFVGTGADPDDPDQDGFAMAYRHAGGYSRLDDCHIAACADIVPENAAAFAGEFDVDDDRVYEDYETMVREADPDIISVCVPPDIHARVVIDCARAGNLAAIHCEKPMATTWADCREMCQVCEEAGVKLTFNHQKRVGPVYRRAKKLLDAGKIGDLRRVEWSYDNLFDSGTHMFDLSALYAGQSPVEWVMAGLDYREENRWFGVHNENQAIAQWRYENGVYGQATTGRSADALGAQVRLVGDEGTIEVAADDGPPLRIHTGRTLGWKTVEVGANIWGNRTYATPLGFVRWAGEEARRRLPVLSAPDDYPSNIDRSVASAVAAVREDGESPLTWRNAIESTEVIFAAWESARRGARVDLPLEIDDNPLEAMVENGDLPVGSGSAEPEDAASPGEGSGAEADPGTTPDARTDGASPRDGVGTEPGAD